jgi:cytochrome c-type biogenesis protein CcmH
MTTRYHLSLIVVVLAALLLGAALAHAQDSGGVTADEVNAIAAKLYCPVCENIPLDTCGTAACADWRNEIKIALEGGDTEKEIIDDFIHRFGDRVVGIPQDPTLNTISMLPPVIGALLVVLGGAVLIMNLRRQKVSVPTVDNAQKSKTATQELPAHPHDKSKYFDILEQDIKG